MIERGETTPVGRIPYVCTLCNTQWNVQAYEDPAVVVIHPEEECVALRVANEDIKQILKGGPQLDYEINKAFAARYPNARDIRWARGKAHEELDRLWKSGFMPRGDAYNWLAKALNIPRERCHIRLFNLEQCKHVARICGDRWKKLQKARRTCP